MNQNQKDIEEVTSKLNTIEKMGYWHHDVSYSEFESLLSNPRYAAAIDSIDLYLWPSGNCRVNIGAKMPPHPVHNNFVIKLPPYYKDTLMDNTIINSELCMTDTSIPTDVVNIILNNSVFTREAICYANYHVNIHTDNTTNCLGLNDDDHKQYLERTKECSKLVATINKKSSRKFDYSDIRNCFCTNRCDKYKIFLQIIIPIKYKINLNYKVTNRNELIRALCGSSNNTSRTDIYEISKKYNNINMRYYDFQLATENCYYNEAYFAVCNFIIECNKHYNDRFWKNYVKKGYNYDFRLLHYITL
jgi:hypothetical protein